MLWGALVTLSACGDDGSSGGDGVTTPDDGQGGDGQTETNNGTTQEQVQYLSPTDHLVRASMALRGVRPSVEELETVRANPDALPGVVDTYIESEAFGTTIRDMHN
ncbi:MAG: hypothetical protein AAFS10_18225, partial [Myxococcota bacterium]